MLILDLGFFMVDYFNLELNMKLVMIRSIFNKDIKYRVDLEIGESVG